MCNRLHARFGEACLDAEAAESASRAGNRRKVTIRDVARAAQVSVATVSRALSGSEAVKASTRGHVLRVAGELDFVPHAGAQSLSLQRTDTIGVILPDLHGEYFSELIRGLDLGARSSRQHLLFSASHGDISEAIAALRAMRSRVDGSSSCRPSPMASWSVMP